MAFLWHSLNLEHCAGFNDRVGESSGFVDLLKQYLEVHTVQFMLVQKLHGKGMAFVSRNLHYLFAFIYTGINWAFKSWAWNATQSRWHVLSLVYLIFIFLCRHYKGLQRQQRRQRWSSVLCHKHQFLCHSSQLQQTAPSTLSKTSPDPSLKRCAAIC